ncbi:MAG: hypothetical protein IKR31_02175 [Prevotella sp.]|nr:hypothetical protein [Prevotella sp.]
MAPEGLVFTAAHHRLDFVDVVGQLEVLAAALLTETKLSECAQGTADLYTD